MTNEEVDDYRTAYAEYIIDKHTPIYNVGLTTKENTAIVSICGGDVEANTKKETAIVSDHSLKHSEKDKKKTNKNKQRVINTVYKLSDFI